MQRMMSFAAVYFSNRSLAMQRAAVQFYLDTYGEREAWVYHRQENEFDVYYNADLNTSKDLDPHYWLNHYRMCRETFDYVCSIVNDFMKKEDTNMRESIPVPKRVGVALWWLGNGETYRSVGQTFGISAAAVGCITKDFVGALVNLRNRFIVWPRSEEQCLNSVKSFENLSPLPNVFGAIDGTHIRIKAPEESTVDFFDRKQCYSIGCQGVCDGKLRFISMSTGFAGSMHDSRMLRNTWIYDAGNDKEIMQTPVYPLTATKSIKPYLVGDAAYPMHDWLIKPYQYAPNMDHEEKVFNLALSQARVSIERAFGILKGRWRILLDKVLLEPSYVADIVTACSVLHNICQDRKEPIEEVVDPYHTNNCDTHYDNVYKSGETIRRLLRVHVNSL